MTKTPIRKIRCAIYTRKSSEEGLDMEFNSLDAQREACEAYVTSQKREGWVQVPDRYDDGGFSGGTLERPALKRLLAPDIVQAILDGCQPKGLALADFMEPFPVEWERQRMEFGFLAETG